MKMGESNLRKSRNCRSCKQSIHGTAIEMQDHANSCARMARLGLVTPGLLVDAQASEALNNARAAVQRKKALRPTMGGRA